MQLKYTVNEFDFHVDSDSGSMIIRSIGCEVEVPHSVALELIETIRRKLIDHQERNESLLNRLFK